MAATPDGHTGLLSVAVGTGRSLSCAVYLHSLGNSKLLPQWPQLVSLIAFDSIEGSGKDKLTLLSSFNRFKE